MAFIGSAICTLFFLYLYVSHISNPYLTATTETLHRSQGLRTDTTRSTMDDMIARSDLSVRAGGTAQDPEWKRSFIFSRVLSRRNSEEELTPVSAGKKPSPAAPEKQHKQHEQSLPMPVRDAPVSMPTSPSESRHSRSSARLDRPNRYIHDQKPVTIAAANKHNGAEHTTDGVSRFLPEPITPEVCASERLTEQSPVLDPLGDQPPNRTPESFIPHAKPENLLPEHRRANLEALVELFQNTSPVEDGLLDYIRMKLTQDQQTTIFKAIEEQAFDMPDTASQCSGESMSDMPGMVREIRDDIDEVKGESSEVKNHVMHLEDAFTHVKCNVAGMEGVVNGVRGDVAGMRGVVDDVKGDFAGVKAAMVRTMMVVARVTKTVDGFKDDFTSLQGAVTGLTEQFAAYKNGSANTQSAVTGLTAQVTGIKDFIVDDKAELASVSKTVAGFKEDSAGMQSAVTGLTEQVAGFKDSIGDLLTVLTTMKGDLTSVKFGLSNLESDVAAMKKASGSRAVDEPADKDS